MRGTLIRKHERNGYGMGEEPRDGNQEIRTRAGEETERWEPEDMNHVRGEERWDGSQKI